MPLPWTGAIKGDLSHDVVQVCGLKFSEEIRMPEDSSFFEYAVVLAEASKSKVFLSSREIL